MKRLALVTLLACFSTGIFAQGAAGNYPSRPVKIVVPFGPGGFTDVTARILAQKLTVSMGQSFVIENKPGAGSIIGTESVAKSPADGYTLVIVSSTHVISPSIYKKIPYDPIKSFAPISKLVDSPYVLLVNPKVPAKNVQEFVALAKSKPGTIHYASSGNGSAQHLIGGLFASMTQAPLKHVPYRGSNLAATDLVAGVVESSFAGVPNALVHVPTGKLRALAVSSAKRVAQLPDVPTMQEAGVAGYDASVWLALLAPAGTPPAIVNRLNTEVAKIMTAPDSQKALFDAGVEVSLSSPDALGKLMATDLVRWSKLIKEIGIELE